MFIKESRDNYWMLHWLDQFMIGHKGFICGGCFKNIFNKEKVKDLDIFFNDICNVKPNFDIYNNKKDENIKGYILDEVNSSNSNLMIVNNNSSEIEDIKIVNIKVGVDLLQ